MKNQSITEAMLQFIEESPTAFHAAANVEALLLENGFEKLENLAEGALVPGGSYYTMQNGSAVLAVKIPENPFGSHFEYSTGRFLRFFAFENTFAENPEIPCIFR